LKKNPCSACYSIFELIEEIILRIKQDEALHAYEVQQFLTSYFLPVTLDLTSLQFWLALIEKFPNSFNSIDVPYITIKDAIKYVLNAKLSTELNKKYNTDGIMISITFSIENEKEMLDKLDVLFPELMFERNKQK
jgi:hypothetical protein